jgi:hypothetical protein
VEIRPEAVRGGHWGEGPIEMPFCALVARNAGITTFGMDDWSDKMERREDRMVQNITEQIAGAKRVLVMTGYSHIAGFVHRLQKKGYVLQDWSKAERKKLLRRPVDKRCPPELRQAYADAIRRAQAGITHYNKKWIRVRQRFLKTLP